MRDAGVGFARQTLLMLYSGRSIAGILGARLEYVLINPEYFGEQPGSAFAIWQGGFAYYGGLLAGILALGLWTRL